MCLMCIHTFIFVLLLKMHKMTNCKQGSRLADMLPVSWYLSLNSWQCCQVYAGVVKNPMLPFSHKNIAMFV